MGEQGVNSKNDRPGRYIFSSNFLIETILIQLKHDINIIYMMKNIVYQYFFIIDATNTCNARTLRVVILKV